MTHRDCSPAPPPPAKQFDLNVRAAPPATGDPPRHLDHARRVRAQLPFAPRELALSFASRTAPVSRTAQGTPFYG
ncbi:hypothetical protein GCM10023203_38050 [Actinomycetospora straminea]|uniref:Uncharacterized protein n=1 Tax=Actinomycetospora straminea TaxID=663607 RepID=A0ABP9EWH1_9PSEU